MLIIWNLTSHLCFHEDKWVRKEQKININTMLKQPKAPHGGWCWCQETGRLHKTWRTHTIKTTVEKECLQTLKITKNTLTELQVFCYNSQKPPTIIHPGAPESCLCPPYIDSCYNEVLVLLFFSKIIKVIVFFCCCHSEELLVTFRITWYEKPKSLLPSLGIFVNSNCVFHL